MGIPKGISVIVGGGFHGKSVLLKALEVGVYNHIPGDGREFVVCDPSAVKIRAEDGRSVENVNISPFICNLPFGQSTNSFRTACASGSTSQSANIIEALEIGSSLLLIDEDTSATNFMIRDKKMQMLIHKDKEPITPLVYKIMQLSREHGVSVLLVMGGSGDYFDVADHVIMMDNFVPKDVTKEAHQICLDIPANSPQEVGPNFGPICHRIPTNNFASDGKIRGIELKSLSYGYRAIDISVVEQLVEPHQVTAIGDLLQYIATKYVDGRRTLKQIITAVDNELSSDKGLAVLEDQRPFYTRPRAYEIAAVLNRLREVTVVQQVPPAENK